jgi:hypothetical protein
MSKKNFRKLDVCAASGTPRPAAEQGDQMSWRKKAPKMWPNPFLTKSKINFYRVKNKNVITSFKKTFAKIQSQN